MLAGVADCRLAWQRYGQVVPGLQVSGLEEEFELSGELPRCCMSRRRRRIASPAWLIC